MSCTEHLEMEPDYLCEENIYSNTCDLDVRRTKKTPKAKEILAARSRKYRVILILGVLLILAFLILFILTGVMFHYYKSIREEMSQMNDKSIEDTISQMKSNNKIIEEEITQLKANNSGLTKDVSDLHKSVANITDVLNKIKLIINKDSGLTKDVSDLQKSVASITDDLNKIKLIVNKGGTDEAVGMAKLISVAQTVLQGAHYNRTENIQDSCTSCPSGWQLIKSNCYYFQANGETWSRSREECGNRKGVMLILKDKAELDSLLPTIGNGRYWLGLRRDSGNINHWLWADGSSLSFSPWNAGEPNNDKGQEYCAEILGGAQSMNDRDCEHKIGYICEKAWTC